MAVSVCGKRVTIIKEAARQLGFRQDTIRDLIRANGIVTYRVKYSPAARGIDDDGMNVLRRAAGRSSKATKISND